MRIGTTLVFTALIVAMAIVPSSSALAADAPKVTIQNFVRAETDLQMRNYVENMDAYGKFAHVREAYDVTSRDTIRPNRDRLYSWSVFDVTSPLTICLPDPGDRYQSLMIVSQDHSIWSEYGPKDVVLDEETVGTRYALLLLRTFLDPNDEEDVKAAHALLVLSRGNVEPGATFGRKEDVDPVRHLLATAWGWGGLPEEEAYYLNVEPNLPVGAYQLTFREVPVDAFWSVTVYNKEGFIDPNDQDAYSVNSLTGTANDDGSFTIHFGGDPGSINHLPIAEGWNYTVRFYQPRKEILDGTWKFPEVKPVASK